MPYNNDQEPESIPHLSEKFSHKAEFENHGGTVKMFFVNGDEEQSRTLGTLQEVQDELEKTGVKGFAQRHAPAIAPYLH